MTTKRYLEERRLSGITTVTVTGRDERGNWIRLSETLFHPQGGGQKADRGWIASGTVVHVAHAEPDEVNHYIQDAGLFTAGQEVRMEIDAGWREANTLLHTGGHLIAGVAEGRFPGLRAVTGHHWPGEARVEFESEGGSIPSGVELVTDLQKGVEEAIRADMAVRIIGDPYRSRAIQINSYRAIPCGGTHLERTGTITALVITGVRTKSGKVRVSYGI